MKTKYFIRFALTCAAVFALGTMTSCDDDGGEEPAPGITITTQPTAPATLTEGQIPANTTLTVEATATGGATLSYLWYLNTTASNTGGTAIDGATAANYTLPTTLTEGTYYYFCELSAEGIESKRSDIATVTVLPISQNGRITWRDGKYVLTTDPTDAGLLFKFGSVVGLFTGNGAVLTLPSTDKDDFDAGDIAWDPTDATTWEGIPVHQATDYPADVDAAYHTAANVKAGKGDPCRLVGLDLAKIKSTATASLTTADIDNGQLRLPTNAENQSFVGYTTAMPEISVHWTTLGGVNGGMFPDATKGSETTFLPVTGFRPTGAFVNAGRYASYWSGTPVTTTKGYSLSFGQYSIFPSGGDNYVGGFSVRCVRR